MQESSATSGARADVWRLLDGVLQDQQLILASNRGPMEHHVQPNGEVQARRGSGGVVTALSSLTGQVEFTWIASAMGEGDRRVAAANHGRAVRSPLPGQRVSVRYVTTSRRTYHSYYNVICNPLLWFLQHYMWSSPYTPRIDGAVYEAWENGYTQVNREFANAIIEEAGGETRPLVMLHDYHLYLAPGMVRAALPQARIQLFLHIPWPASSYWELLPGLIRNDICASLCNADIVGFQSERDARAFLDSCDLFLDGAEVDYNAKMVRFGGRETLARAYPISINVEEVRRIAASPRAAEYEQRLRGRLGEQTIIRVDRTEPSKNIIRGFSAFETLLEHHPEFIGRVKFLAFLVPSRTHIRQYQRYLEEVDQTVQRINHRFESEGFDPITVFYENNYIQAIAAMRLYDVLMVNSVIDGMNLVSKEGPVVNQRDGVLVLSESAGAHAQLKVGALPVAPADVEGTARALHQALTMPAEERAARNKAMVEVISNEDITHWLRRQLEDVAALDG